MKVRESDGTIVNIFAMYWFGGETYFYGLPQGYGGLLAYKADEVSVIESEVDFKSVYFENNAKSVQHWALMKEKLLDDLLERDETAYNRFLQILKSEGRVVLT